MCSSHVLQRQAPRLCHSCGLVTPAGGAAPVGCATPAGSAVPAGCATPAGGGSLARSSFLWRVLRPRWAAVRMAPGRLPRMWPAVAASRPRTARSRTASAWSGGRVAIRATAWPVVTASMAVWAVSAAAPPRPGGEVFGGDGQGRAAGGLAEVVQGAVAGDGGDPAAEPVVAAGEAGQVAGDLEPGLGGDVLGVLAGQWRAGSAAGGAGCRGTAAGTPPPSPCCARPTAASPDRRQPQPGQSPRAPQQNQRPQSPAP